MQSVCSRWEEVGLITTKHVVINYIDEHRPTKYKACADDSK